MKALSFRRMFFCIEAVYSRVRRDFIMDLYKLNGVMHT